MQSVTVADEALVDLIDENVRRNVRTLMAFGNVPSSRVYTALGLNRQKLSARLTGTTRFSAAEVAILAVLFQTSTDRLYGEPEDLLKPDPTREPQPRLRQRLEDALRSLDEVSRSRWISNEVRSGYGNRLLANVG